MSITAILHRLRSVLRPRGRRSAGSDVGDRLDRVRNDAVRRGDISQQGPTWGGGPF